MKINFNASAILANNSLVRHDNQLSETMGRLSSGLKIVNAKDNPSGLAMAKRMNAQLKGLEVATDDAKDGISIIDIADGALGEIHSILQRMNELAVKAANGTMMEEDRKIVDEEAQQLKVEIGRISDATEFNGKQLLDGSFDLRGYTYIENTPGTRTDAAVKVNYYNDDVKPGLYEVDAFTADLGATVTITGQDANTRVIKGEITKIDGNIITITGDDFFELKLDITTGIPGGAATPFFMDLTGFGSLDKQIGANEGQQIDIRIPRVAPEDIGIGTIDLTKEESAGEAISQVQVGIKYISSVRSRLGAYQNRLEHTVSNLDITSENMTDAYSRIMDADMAEEMTEYTTLQVLSQASTSILAQANERPAQVLQLLQ